MNQIELIDAAKQQQGLTSDNQLALRLGVTRSRVSQIARNKKPADEAEIMMLADMAELDPHLAFAAVHADREKNPAKRDYWLKISRGIAMGALVGTLGLAGLSGDVEAKVVHEEQRLTACKLCEYLI